ncbi:FKBP-type peptidyl-prolyl cis-trans isomerase [Neolewinella antarctica]|uniref:Peptidyl-prolyl cis-trans isomerase n=1 Tax=Neolewinella antarctica TaxID=442734 RepID=A0ABX0X701_9BACT|nr:FKBP-type peptidyl-prolyl cis-trans isomerase [Neolewinella antarctica]NJC25006.1 FKBP-type peptidyl-prolyl cis-trans isomerase FkpA [Neolewinella antarctica]
MRILTLALLASVLFTGCESDGGETMTTELGRTFEIFKSGDGPVVKPGDYVSFNATIKTQTDSTLFSTYATGGDLPMIQAVAMDTEDVGDVEDIIRYMRVGDSATVQVKIVDPRQRAPGMENDTVTFYTVKPFEILSEEEFEIRRDEKMAEMEAGRSIIIARGEERNTFAAGVIEQYNAGDLDDQLETTASGLKYIVHEQGSGAQAQAGQGVVVQYIGALVEDGSVFDQSFERGQGIPFRLGTGSVIPGWDEGIALLKEGDKATFFIPSALAYGANGTPDGSIPANSELAFYVELEEVQ